MKKRLLCGIIAALFCLTTACSSQGSNASGSTEQKPAGEESVTQEAAASADTSDISSAARAGTAEESTAASTAVSTAASTAAAAAAADKYAADGKTGMYEDERGWYVLYTPALFTVEEAKDDVKFHYTGEAAGENYVEIRYISDKQPKEVLTAEIEALTEEHKVEDEDAINRDEAFFYEDKWCYTASVRYSEEDRDTTVSYQSGEYNGGVLLTKVVEVMTDENVLEGFMHNELWNVLNTISFYDYQPQELFYYVPGTYSKADYTAEDGDGEEDANGDAGEAGTAAAAAETADTAVAAAAESADTTSTPAAETDAADDTTAAETDAAADDSTAAPASETDDTTAAAAAETADTAENPDADEDADEEIAISPEEAFEQAPDQIILKKNHTGHLVSEEKSPVFWGSYLLTEKNTTNSYEYDIEGDNLYLNIGGNWIEYKKTEEAAPEDNKLDDPEYLNEVNREIDFLYHDGIGKTGRIRKMQAFLLELALHAKTQNPDFKVVAQNAAYLAYIDGQFENGDQSFIKDLVDGWSTEGIVGKDDSLTPSVFQKIYVDQVKKGKFVSDTTTVSDQKQLQNYLARANAWGIAPYPKLGGELAKGIMPGKRWADNGDYFWVEDPSALGIGDRIDSKRDVTKLKDAKNFLYNINSRPYDNWQDWDQEEKAFAKGSGDRTRIMDSYACGLLVPSENGKYTPVTDSEEETAAVIEEYGDKWDWWWREQGLDETKGRETWLEALRNSDYDVIYIDSFYNHRARPEEQTPLTAEEVESLKYKPGGGRRQVIAYLDIGSAEQNRWYCQDDWIWIDPKNKNSTYNMKAGMVIERGTDKVYVPFIDSLSAKEAENTAEPPVWLAFGYGHDYPEEAVVQWWHKEWRDIIINGGGKYAHKVTGDNTSSLDRIIAQGFDGVFLDNADACSEVYWDAFEKYWLEHGGIPE